MAAASTCRRRPGPMVGGDKHRAALVPTRDELEEQVRAAPLERQVAEFVDDQQLGLGEEGELVGELAFGLGLGEGGEQRGRADEQDGVAGLDDGAAQRDGEMGLADARRTEQQDVVAGGDEAAGGELAYELGVDAGLELEVEVVEGLRRREDGVDRGRGASRCHAARAADTRAGR